MGYSYSLSLMDGRMVFFLGDMAVIHSGDIVSKWQRKGWGKNNKVGCGGCLKIILIPIFITITLIGLWYWTR